MALTMEAEVARLDIAWIIALWIAIHGGDPGPEISDEVAEFAARALVAQLQERYPGRARDAAAVKERLARLGISTVPRKAEPGRDIAAEGEPKTSQCISIDAFGDVICLRYFSEF